MSVISFLLLAFSKQTRYFVTSSKAFTRVGGFKPEVQQVCPYAVFVVLPTLASATEEEEALRKFCVDPQIAAG